MQNAQYTAELLVGDGGVCAVANYTEMVAFPPPPNLCFHNLCSLKQTRPDDEGNDLTRG
jgi:hypothetical protein